MFAFLLSVYVRQELSVDGFHVNRDRICMMVRDHNNDTYMSAFSNPVADAVRDKCPEVESYTRVVTRDIEIATGNGEKILSKALFADSAFFRIFSFPLTEGDASQALAVKQSAVISRSYAAKMFPDGNAVGKTLRIDSIDVTVNGIMNDFPQNTMFQRADLVLNYRMIEQYWYSQIMTDWANSSFPLFLLTVPGADLSAKAPVLLEYFTENYWIYKEGFSRKLEFVALKDVYFGNIGTSFGVVRKNDRFLISTYLGIVFLILIVAILNYVNLSTSQAMKRGRESAIRKLLGSSRHAAFVQYILESALMTFASLLLGIFLAFLAEPFFNDVLNTDLHLAAQFTPGFTLALLGGTVLTGIVSGLFPAWVVSRFKPVEVVKGTYSYRVRTVYSKILITFQYVVAIVLLIYSAVIVRQNDYLQHFDLGYDTDRLFVMSNKLERSQLPGFRDLLAGIAGVERVSFAAGTPLDGGNNNSFQAHGEPVSFQVFEVDTAFFDLFGISFTPTGAATGGDRMTVLNRRGYDVLRSDSAADEFVLKGDSYEITVGGIAGDFHFRSLREPVGNLMIRVWTEYGYYPWSIIVKMSPGADIFRTADLVKAAYTAYSGETNFEAKFADEMIQGRYEADRKNMKIILAFTILTIVILMMGILSMALYYVRQREKEIAVRKVHGGTVMEIMSMLNSGFTRFILIAFVIAVPVAWYFSDRFLRDFAYKTSLSWWIFAAAGLFALLLSMFFISMQSWRTVTTNPVKMLKNE
jgi:putative ABC transport system permease protein